MKQVHTLIIGAGPSGLSLAYHMQKDTLVLEKEDRVGGICRSITQKGGVFDIGGHSFHTPHPEVYELVNKLLDGGFYEQQRDARVYTHGTLIPYPFQKNYDQTPNPDVVKACEEGLRQAIGNAGEANNLEEYIIRKFGTGIAEHFMLPYNRKLWARDIKQISCEWTSERVAGAKDEREKFETIGGKRNPLQANTQVEYPRKGGYEEIYKKFVPHLPDLDLNSTVVDIDPVTHTTITADGRQYQWDVLVSTIPLPVQVRLVRGTPNYIIAMADELDYMSLRVELLLVGRALDTSIQRIYLADPDIPPHKIALNHNSSSYLRQKSCHAIMAEVSISPEKAVDVDNIASNTISFLCELGILHTPDDIIWQGHVDVKYAYPIYTHERPELVKQIKKWMEQHAIYTLGRFGDWEYINSDRCVWKGMELAHFLARREATEVYKR